MLQNFYTDTENSRYTAGKLSYHEGKRGATGHLSDQSIRGKQVLL
jgi:hypothetical protein